MSTHFSCQPMQYRHFLGEHVTEFALVLLNRTQQSVRLWVRHLYDFFQRGARWRICSVSVRPMMLDR